MDTVNASVTTVEAVHEVHRVDDGYRQRQRDQDRRHLIQHNRPHPTEWDVDHAPGHPHGDQHARGGDLTREFGERIQAPFVVDETDDHDDAPRDDDGRHARGVDETPCQRG
ncbi:Uncharacterised protein [Mycobacteroides abscessus subsp. abscessus]|nr:Uncharacterised protein [Mycobacteroides abscessus subsp. abscessus]